MCCVSSVRDVHCFSREESTFGLYNSPFGFEVTRSRRGEKASSTCIDFLSFPHDYLLATVARTMPVGHCNHATFVISRCQSPMRGLVRFRKESTETDKRNNVDSLPREAFQRCIQILSLSLSLSLCLRVFFSPP